MQTNHETPSLKQDFDTLRRWKDNPDTSARRTIAKLFDEGTFVEYGAFTSRSFKNTLEDSTPEGLITGYGAIDGRLVFAFIQDVSAKFGAVDRMHAKKFSDFYQAAMKNAAPIIGVFDSAGADLAEGACVLPAYAEMIKCAASAKGKLPQIALVTGVCVGTLSVLASMFDFTLSLSDTHYLVTDENGTKAKPLAMRFPSLSSSVRYIQRLLAFLPSSSDERGASSTPNDDINRSLGELSFDGTTEDILLHLTDYGLFLPCFPDYAPTVTTAFATIAGISCLIVGTNHAVANGMIDTDGAKKLNILLSFCDNFSIPVITLIDSLGFDPKSAGDAYASTVFAELALTLAQTTMPRIAIVLGDAIGASFTLLGTKSLGADLVYALEQTQISPLTAESSVAFAWNNKITKDISRESLEEHWQKEMSSPVAAALLGAIDDIIPVTEMRKHICAGLLMLTQNTAHWRNKNLMKLGDK